MSSHYIPSLLVSDRVLVFCCCCVFLKKICFSLLTVCSVIPDEFRWDWDLGKETPWRCTEPEKNGIFWDFQRRRGPALGPFPGDRSLG